MTRSTRPSWRRQLGELVAVAAGEQLDRALGQPGLGHRLAHERRQRPVGALGVAGAAQDDRVAALQRQRGAVDGHVRPRLVDDRDHAERHPHLAQVEAARERLALELLADRVGERGDRRARPSAIAAIRSCVSVSRSRSAPVSRAARSSARSAAFASRISSVRSPSSSRGRRAARRPSPRSRRSPAPRDARFAAAQTSATVWSRSTAMRARVARGRPRPRRARSGRGGSPRRPRAAAARAPRALFSPDHPARARAAE